MGTKPLANIIQVDTYISFLWCLSLIYYCFIHPNTQIMYSFMKKHGVLLHHLCFVQLRITLSICHLSYPDTAFSKHEVLKLHIKAVRMKSICSTASKYCQFHMIIWLWAWHISSHSQTVQQNEYVTAQFSAGKESIPIGLMNSHLVP